MDQDGFSLFIAVAAVSILVSGLVRGAFEIQCVRASRSDRPLPYWLSALALVLIALEAFRRAWFVGCASC